ncbi:hypothetical protein KKF34_13245 [Myxococcota bacterium]|nr:hypothetical protein [Myxococcota bacterium]MBU1381933.1 hypothetical protein [Myxococcota bacterium]MBU1497834.1 hypothetical protein [Myxococcota bacterium]
MKKFFASSVLVIALLIPVTASAKVCFHCSGKKPVKYVCAAKDTFTARKNARKLGCKITGYVGSCKCGANVSHKIDFETVPYWMSLLVK